MFWRISHGHESELVTRIFVKRTTASDVLIILDVADSAVVERTDGPEETNDHQKAQGQGDCNDRPGVQFNAAAEKSVSRSRERRKKR